MVAIPVGNIVLMKRQIWGLKNLEITRVGDVIFVRSNRFEQ
jgi:hypothetical protein